MLVLDARLVDLDPLDGDNALLGREEPRVRRRVREQEPASKAQLTPDDRSGEATDQNKIAVTKVIMPVMIMSLRSGKPAVSDG